MKYAKYILVGIITLLAVVFFSNSGLGARFWSEELTKGGDGSTYALARVEKINNEGLKGPEGYQTIYQDVSVMVLSGKSRGQRELIEHGGDFSLQDFQKVHTGEYVVLVTTSSDTGISGTFIMDSFRLLSAFGAFLFFLGLAILFGGRKGALAVLGAALGLGVLVKYIVPSIISGKNPFMVSMIGVAMIAIVSLTISHGWTRRTRIALVATLVTLALSAGISALFVALTRLTGAGTEEAFLLRFGPLSSLNLQGLLLAGIMVGTMGVLDDVTTAQAATVEEIHAANATLNFKELYARGTSVGREHIASLVNTLVLAYAGASLPLFLLFVATRTQPLWVILNQESIIEEIVRTLAGSSALILAVPITTALAAWSYHKKPLPPGQQPNETHHH